MSAGRAPGGDAMIETTNLLSPMVRAALCFTLRKATLQRCGNETAHIFWLYLQLIGLTQMVIIHSTIAVLLSSRRIVVLLGLNGEIQEWRIVRLQRYSGK